MWPWKVLAALALGLGLSAEARALDPRATTTNLDQVARRAWPRVQQTSAVRALLPSRTGYLWIGTADGLVRFDGQSMVGFDGQRLAGIVTGNIERLFEASDGTLWVASRDEGLSRIQGNEVASVGRAAGLPSALVRGFAESADGTVWTATFAGVVGFARGSLRPEPRSEGLADPRVDSILVDGSGALWAGTRGGLHRWDGEARRWRTDLGPRSAPVRVHALLAGPDGTLLVGTVGAGLWERRGSQWRSNKEIGESLGIAESTVKGHINHVFGKLGVTDRTKALVVAVKRGLIQID